MVGITWTKFTRFYPLKQRLIALFLFFICIPFIALNVLFVVETEKFIVAKTTETLTGMVDQNCASVLRTMKKYIGICQSFSNSPSLREALNSRNKTPIIAFEKYLSTSKALSNEIIAGNYNMKIHVYYENKSFPRDMVTFIRVDDETQREPFYMTSTKNKHVNWTVDNNIILSRSIQGYSNNSLGVFCLEIDRTEVFSEIEQFPKPILLYIIDRNKNILASNAQASDADSSDEDWIRYQDVIELGRSTYETEKYKIIISSLSTDVEHPEWYYVAFIPSHLFTDEAVKIKLSYMMSSVALISFAFAIFVVSINNITKRLKMLIANMHETGKGQFQTTSNNKACDEIGQLIDQFNIMNKNLDDMIKNNYDARIELQEKDAQKREAEFRALQSQINPHFLFNIMQSVNMKLEIGSYDEASKMIICLSRLLHHSLGRNDNIVQLSDELDLVQNYLLIQKYRYKERLRFYINAPEHLLKHMLPKLSIQPIVENSIVHGIENKVEGGSVRIEVSQEYERIVIEVIDDGIGIDTMLLSEINETLTGPNTTASNKHIGLKNIHDRLFSYFGPGFNMLIESEVGKGTRIVIKIPEKGVKKEEP